MVRTLPSSESVSFSVVVNLNSVPSRVPVRTETSSRVFPSADHVALVVFVPPICPPASAVTSLPSSVKLRGPPGPRPPPPPPPGRPPAGGAPAGGAPAGGPPAGGAPAGGWPPVTLVSIEIFLSSWVMTHWKLSAFCVRGSSPWLLALSRLH